MTARIEVEDNGYRICVSSEGLVPMDDLGKLGDLVSRVHKVGSDAGLWEPE